MNMKSDDEKITLTGTIFTLLLLSLFGILMLRVVAQGKEQAFEERLATELQDLEYQTEAFSEELEIYKSKNKDLELTIEILADQIRLKNMELEELGW